MMFSKSMSSAAAILTLSFGSAMLVSTAPTFAEKARSREDYMDGTAARAAVAGARHYAREHDHNVVIIFGTDRCHDTRALLEWFLKPDVRQSLGRSFEFVLVESGVTRDRNLDLARQFGVNRIEGTPSLIIVSGRDGSVVNRKAVAKLRTAASMTSEERMAYFDKYRP